MIFDSKCARHRNVRNCGDCCRFKNCRDNIPYEPPSDVGCFRLGCAIVLSVVTQYKNAYRKGKKNTCKALEKWLRSEEPYILTAEKFNGNAIADALNKQCSGIDKIYKRKLANAEKEIASLKQQIKECNDIKKKNKLKVKIHHLRGELNE